MSVELEVKLIAEDGIDEAAVVATLGEVATVSEAKEGEHHDVYLDTPDGRLAAAGLGARLRHKGNRYRLELKPVPLDAGLVMQREEIGLDVDSAEAAGAALQALLRDRFHLHVDGPLGVQLELRTRRRRHRVVLDGTEAELAIDRVQVGAPGRADEAGFTEVELELREGSPSTLLQLGERLAELDELRPSGQSKLVRARSLLGLPGFEFEVPPLGFDDDTPAEAVARAVGGRLLATMRLHEPGTRVGLDTEHLHKMRVATRRLRTALRVFRRQLPKADREALTEEVRWLARKLGEVRDLDVQLLELPRWRARHHGDAKAEARGWSLLERELQTRRDAARRLLLEALDSRRYASLIERGTAVFGSTPDEGGIRIGKLGPKLLARRVARLEQALERFERTHDPEDAHRLRIVVKRLRYTSEFLRPILGSEVRDRIKRLVQFQDELGGLQDAVLAGSAARRLRDEAGSSIDPDFAFVLGCLAGASDMATELARPLVDAAVRRLDPQRISKLLDDED